MADFNNSYVNAKIQRALGKFGMQDNKKRSEDRLPPGQYLTQQFPILDLGVRPELGLKDFKLDLLGNVEKPLTLTSEEFLSLPYTKIKKDFHCVTSWSKFDLEWEGIPFTELFNVAKPKDLTKFVIFVSRDGYTTNLSLEDCLKESVIAAYKLDGNDIPLLHGGPVRMIVPHLYGWKSAKFLKAIIFSEKDEPGFWETRGYNNHGDPWLEERYS